MSQISMSDGPQPDLNIKLHDGTDEQISVIVVHRNRPEYLNITLQSIAVNSTSNNYELIVVDNASDTPESVDYLANLDHDDVKVVRCERNLYWSGAANRGAAAANPMSKYLIFLHCDVVVLNPAWMDLLVSASESQGAGLVGTELQSYYLDGKKADFIQEWCVLLSRECWNDVGPWPEELPMVGHSFLMTARAQYRGWKPQFIRTTLAHHYRIFSLSVNEYEKITEQAQAVLPGLLQRASNK